MHDLVDLWGLRYWASSQTREAGPRLRDTEVSPRDGLQLALDHTRHVPNTATVDREAVSTCPTAVQEFAAQTVRYVQAVLGVELGYDSDTLPVLDHYLRSVPDEKPATLALVVSTAGAYFGEVVRRQLGGQWDVTDREPIEWLVTLPSGLSVSPAGMVAAVIARSDDLDEVETGLQVPTHLEPAVEATLERMSQVTEDEYYSLCGRFDTLAHLQEVLASIAAAQRRGQLN